MQYAGMAFQMGIIIFLGTFGGKKLDEKFATERPWFTLAGAILGLILAFYTTLKDLIFYKK
ncbi:MAG: AtpZ/AtpI family protein [Bacteroidetes bacterium]|nr:MAG: AtpZ/AtpI family protein [Bacteroidota bacterium]